jgi:hypothetical protein
VEQPPLQSLTWNVSNRLVFPCETHTSLCNTLSLGYILILPRVWGLDAQYQVLWVNEVNHNKVRQVGLAPMYRNQT